LEIFHFGESSSLLGAWGKKPIQSVGLQLRALPSYFRGKWFQQSGVRVNRGIQKLAGYNQRGI
jgi:hypothetical protein